MPKKKTAPAPEATERKYVLRQCKSCPTKFVPGRPRRETGHPTGFGDKCSRCQKRASRNQPPSATPERLTDGRQRVPHKISLHPDLEPLVTSPDTLKKYGVKDVSKLVSKVLAEKFGHPEWA